MVDHAVNQKKKAKWLIATSGIVSLRSI